jgi:hypothetical protein
MTLIIAGANSDFAFLVSDRRFTYQNGYVDDERNKAMFFRIEGCTIARGFHWPRSTWGVPNCPLACVGFVRSSTTRPAAASMH